MYKLKNSVIILILVMLIIGSCKKSSKKDLSFTAKEYQKMGMPDHNKLWSNDDYILAIITLSTIKLNDPLSFPRKHSKKSGAIFTRFVNKENLSFVNDTTLSLRDRAFQIQHFLDFQNELSQMYTNNLKDEQYYNEELIDTYIFGLFVHEKMLELARKIMNSKKESDISIQSGLKTVLYNYLNMIYIVLGEQEKSKTYLAKDLDRLSMEVSRSLIANRELIIPADRQKITNQIQSVIEESPSEYVKNNYRKTLKILNDTN